MDESVSESTIRYLIEEQPSVGSALQKAANQPAFAFAFAFASAFLFSFPWRTHSEIVRGRAGWVRG
ncbi:hypothetical protein, partial [Stenotrophomonas sp.]|uniref:hypothetical protein n=1 Tax=Stenotrophomonas sp. TaxID=69392 RepID=UPI0025863540